MMAGKDTEGKSEVVVVRRRAPEDAAGGKGGAWKIAYADFVTAMMAFFLVMWLINASNEETRSQVASYFNPIKLTDTSTGARSLKDTKVSTTPQEKQRDEGAVGHPPSKKDARDEAEILADPPKSLDRISNVTSAADFSETGLDKGVEIASSLEPHPSNPGVGDPFDPRSSNTKSATYNPKGEQEKDDTGSKRIAEEDQNSGAKPEAESQAAELRRDIRRNLRDSEKRLASDIDVKTNGDGLLVSLTESADFEMFKSGSAEPEPQMLALVRAIADALKARPGSIVVRGHTDSRPYRNKYYDNWQLSTARANLARYMLIRGGLDASRIRRVEGVADLEPKNTSDPQAPENRRIEIFIGGTVP